MTLTIRPATLSESGTIASVFRQSRQTCMSYLPTLHTFEEDKRYIQTQVLPNQSVWVAEQNGGLIGFCAFNEGWLNHLYLLPEACGQKVGEHLLAKAKENTDHLQLWVFQANEGAIRFYKKHGFKLVKETDGSECEEKLPDALYEWTR